MNNKFVSWLKNNIGCILGFIVPMVILGGIFIGREVIPWGDNMYLRSDCYHQYAPFYKELYRKLTEGGSFQFSWNIGMGVNFTAIYAYYLASPVNILLGFLPEGILLHTMDFLIVFKTALAGFTCAYYLSKHFNTKSSAVGAVAVFYALSSYMAAFSWNIMWLDCIILLPIIVLGLEKLVNEGKYKMYTISLGAAIFTNYYIAIMICIFAVIYFFYLIFTRSTSHKMTYYFKKMLAFGFFSLLAGGIGAIMFIPEMYALGYTISGDFSFPELWSNYFSILDMLSRSLIDVPVSIFSAHDPNIYCTVAVFIMVPLYCMCSKVPVKERIGKIVLIAIFLLSFNTNIPNYIWHGFHFPNSLPARESFIYIFLLVVICYEAIIHLKDMTRKQIYGAFAGAVGVILLIEELYVSDDYSFEIIYLSLAFLALYMFLITAYKNKNIRKNFLVYLLFVVCIAEATINSDHEESYKTTSYSGYVEDNEAIEKLVDSVAEKDDSFYRIEKLNRKTKNDAAWNDYHGVSIFSSMANGHFTDYLGSLGFEKSANAYSYYGFTPFTSALLDVKYIISNSFMADDEWYTLYDFDEDSSRYIYRVNYSLPLGFMLPENFADSFEMTGNNPFAIQNNFASLATGYENMFSYIPASSTGTTCAFTVEEDSDVYVYVTTYVDQISFVATSPDGTTVSSNSFSGLNHRQICHFGELPAGTKVTVNTSDTDTTTLQLYAYSLNKDTFENVYNSLNSNGLDVTEYDDTYVKGTITADEDGLMYLSIIYDKGWRAYVDGEEVEITSIKEALLAVPVSAGTHTIELKYHTDGLNKGAALTILSIVILVLIIVFEKRIKLFASAFSKNISKSFSAKKLTKNKSESTSDISDESKDKNISTDEDVSFDENVIKDNIVINNNINTSNDSNNDNYDGNNGNNDDNNDTD